MRRLAHAAYRFYWGEGIADDVPALAYYLVLSLAPFAVGVAALALRLDDALNALAVAAQLNRFLPAAIHGDVERLVTGARDNSPLLLAVSVAAMLWTTSGAIGVIERCLSRILDCPRHNIITGRIRNMALGGAVAAAVVLAALTTTAASDVTDSLGLRGALSPESVFALTSAASVVVFATIYRYAPRTRVSVRASLLGALPAGLGLQLVPAVVGIYVGAVADLQAVRLFLVLAVVLLGLSIVAALVLVGAGIASTTERRRRQAPRTIEAPIDPVSADQPGEAGPDTQRPPSGRPSSLSR
jgi:YihY family inner membrane protein